MSDNKKYYYLKLKDNFFESDSMVLLEQMRDGYLYSNILLKLYLRSLKDSGKLMLNGRIPYNAQMIASVTRHQVGTVEKALKIFEEIGLIEVLENGAIYMLDIQNFIGKSSSEADRVRQYRLDIAAEKIEVKEEESGVLNKYICTDKCTPEIRDKRIEIRNNISTIVDMYNNTCVSFPKVTRLSEKRKKAIKARLKVYTLEDFQKLFEMAEASSFLKGQNGRNWSATFDWLISDSNMAKVIDGNYSDGKNSSSSSAPPNTRFHNFEQHTYEPEELDKFFTNT